MLSPLLALVAGLISPPPLAETPRNIEVVTLAPLFHQPFACTEHPEGALPMVGDALGADCLVLGGIHGQPGFFRVFRSDGRANADWYGWAVDVHAPFEGTVKTVIENRIENSPGHMGRPPASMIIFERPDGLDVVYAHVVHTKVVPGQHVAEGQVVAKVGNNGSARAPHIHVGAFRGREPLQVRWDLRAEGLIPGLTGG